MVTRNDFFIELCKVLSDHNIQNCILNGAIQININQQSIGYIVGNGDAYANGGINSAVAKKLFSNASNIAAAVYEYVQATENAQNKIFIDKEPFKIICGYCNTLLLGKKTDTDSRYIFATTQVDTANDNDFNNTHHFQNNYQKAKEDFVKRSGLANSHHLFSQMQLIEIYKSNAYMLDNNSEIDEYQLKILSEIQTGIEQGVPDLSNIINGKTEDILADEQELSIMNSEPYVLIESSSSAYFTDGEKLLFKIADKKFLQADKLEYEEGEGGSVSGSIVYKMPGDEEYSKYSFKYDIGQDANENTSGLFNHIKAYWQTQEKLINQNRYSPFSSEMVADVKAVLAYLNQFLDLEPQIEKSPLSAMLDDYDDEM
ncbi:MAG: LPD25 domain-containing protein [Christensenella sp.]